MNESISFANADLEITASVELYALRDNLMRWDELFFELTCHQTDDGKFFASFEIDIESKDHTASNLIEAFCDQIERLDEENLTTWREAESRVIDLGYTGSDNCPAFNDLIDSSLLRRMADHHIDLAFTLYPPTIQNQSKC